VVLVLGVVFERCGCEFSLSHRFYFSSWLRIEAVAGRQRFLDCCEISFIRLHVNGSSDIWLGKRWWIMLISRASGSVSSISVSST